jgi:hypothetical protein
LGHIDAHAEPVKIRFANDERSQYNANIHDLCDEEADKFLTGLIMDGEILESFEKRAEKFPRLRIVEGNRVANIPHDESVPESEVFDFSYTPTNEIFVRPFAKMNRIDGEILIRRQKLKLTADWDQWMRKRTQKIKYFDDGTEYIYLSTPNFNFIPITASNENEVPNLQNITIYRADQNPRLEIYTNLNIPANDFHAFVESCLNHVRDLPESERFLQATVEGGTYRMYQDENRNVYIFIPNANMWLKLGNLNTTDN